MSHTIEINPVTHFLFKNTKSAWLWLVVRLYVGYQWIVPGWDKVHDASWIGGKSGAALSGFLQGALAKTAGAHPDVQSWYVWFLENVILPHTALWSHIIAYGELLVGVALIIGAFTGIAAFFGVFMNLNYLLAGTVSINPTLLILGIFLILASRVSGYIGADRWLRPVVNRSRTS